MNEEEDEALLAEEVALLQALQVSLYILTVELVELYNKETRTV